MMKTKAKKKGRNSFPINQYIGQWTETIQFGKSNRQSAKFGFM